MMMIKHEQMRIHVQKTKSSKQPHKSAPQHSKRTKRVTNKTKQKPTKIILIA
jgi:hypothetical protein